MGQKVNPHGLRVGVIKDWDSRWYARNEKVGDLVVEDYKLRQYLKKTLYSAGIPKIEIERDNAKIKIYLHCARPGVVIGKGGAEIERLRLELEKKLGKPVALNIVEVKTPDTDAQLVAETLRTTPRTLDTKNFKERPDRPRRRDGRGGFNRDRKPGYGNRPQGGYNNNRGPRPAAGGSAPKEGGKA